MQNYLTPDAPSGIEIVSTFPTSPFVGQTVIKAGVAKTDSSVRDVIKQKIGKVRKTGRMEDAQSAILQMITQKK